MTVMVCEAVRSDCDMCVGSVLCEAVMSDCDM